MPSDYKLTYFAIKGLAEPIRFLLKYGGIEFEDDRIAFDQWPGLAKSMPFGQMPVLTFNGRQYNQNVAIARFFAKKVNLAGKNDLEALEIDGIVDTITDLRTKVAKVRLEPDETKKAAVKKNAIEEVVPYYFDRFEEIVKKGNGHLACNKLTWADFYITPQFEMLETFLGCEILSKYPNLRALRNKVLAFPSIKEWVKNRPVTDM